jgi:hypothetical protein
MANNLEGGHQAPKVSFLDANSIDCQKYQNLQDLLEKGNCLAIQMSSKKKCPRLPVLRTRQDCQRRVRPVPSYRTLSPSLSRTITLLP